MPVPSTSDITFHNVKTWTNDNNHAEFSNELSIDISTLPIHTRVHDVQTNFVYVRIFFFCHTVFIFVLDDLLTDSNWFKFKMLKDYF